jgi:hypothetical protein
MAKGDRFDVGVRGQELPRRVETEINGRVLKSDFEKESGITWLVITEYIGRTMKPVGTTRFNVADVTYVQANFETE